MPVFTIENPRTGELFEIEAENKDEAITKYKLQKSQGPAQEFEVSGRRTNIPTTISAPSQEAAEEAYMSGNGGGLGTQFVGGANVGASNVIGLPVDAVTGLVNKIYELGGGTGSQYTIPGTPFTLKMPIEKSIGGSESILNALESPQDLRDMPRLSGTAPRTQGERFARKVGEYVGGSAAPAAALAGRTQNITRNLAGEATAATTAGIAEQGLVEATDGQATQWQRTLAGMTGAFTPIGATKILKNIFKPSPKLQEIIDQGNLQANKMKDTAGEIYTSIENNKTIFAPSQNADEFIKELSPTFKQKGWLRTKTNKETGMQSTDIDDKYSIAKGAWEKIGERFYQKNLSGADIMADWRLLNDAQRQAKKAAQSGSASGTEAEIIRNMMTKYEEKFGKYLGTDFKTANSLYRSASNAEELSTALDLANININKISANEYKQLQNKLSQFASAQLRKGKASSFSKEEISAIRDAAKTSRLEDFSMWIGRIRNIVGVPSVGIAGTAAYTGYIDPLLAAGAGGSALAIGSGAQLIARNAQKRDISNMMKKIMNDPKMSEEAKRKALNALSVYLGPSAERAVQDAGQILPITP